MKLHELAIYEPTHREMKLDYPELVEYPEFENLKDKQLKFVWYVANRTSPIIGYKPEKRIAKAIELVYKDKDMPFHEQWRKGEFPDDIKTAVDRMAHIKPDVRLEAKFTIMRIFDQHQKMTVLGEKELDGMDADEKKKYTELSIKIASEMSNMVQLMEKGFGVKTKKKEKRKVVEASLSDVMDEDQ